MKTLINEMKNLLNQIEEAELIHDNKMIVKMAESNRKAYIKEYNERWIPLLERKGEKAKKNALKKIARMREYAKDPVLGFSTNFNF